MPTAIKALWIMLAVTALFLAFESRNSDPSAMILYVLVGVPVLAAFFIMALIGVCRAKASGRLSLLSVSLSFFATAAIPVITFAATHRVLVPSTVRWDFSYPGQTGTYQKVEFRFWADGEWREGPSVEGWPLTCRFPDLNDDGYPDIRVFETHGDSKEPVEFIYLPENDGRIFWKSEKNESRLSAAYKPANYFSNYP